MLELRDLRVHFPVRGGAWPSRRRWVRAVDGVSLFVGAGETLGVVGESGCGKSTLARAAVCLVRPTGGQVLFEEEDLTHLDEAQLRPRRRQFQMIFQDPQGSLNPRMTVGESIAEALIVHKLARRRVDRQQRVARLMESVGLDPGATGRYPHEFSGGQRQRVVLARALAVEPKMIVCDEPVSALDVSVQAQVVNLLRELQQTRGVTYLFISHDLAVVEHISHRILVMYLGRVMELSAATAICRAPRHPYTQALVAAVPVMGRTPSRRLVLSGEMPSPMSPPSGCPFHSRCPVAEARCRMEPPLLRELTPGHWVACHMAR